MAQILMYLLRKDRSHYHPTELFWRYVPCCDGYPFCKKNLILAIPIALAFRLVFDYLFDAAPLKPLIIPVTFIMAYPLS
jgi:hypothetical protein